jgi:gamma-glutamyltranspeptidase/glutathione hydrolase
MAATSHPLSTLAAIDILQAGGNAMDAAIAACAVQCMVEPGSTGIGGDCFALYAPGGGSTLVAYNGSGRAPSGATPEWYAGHGIESIEQQSAHAVTVPGAVEAWERLAVDHGKLGLDRLLRPAIRLAREGYPVASRVHLDWSAAQTLLEQDAGSRKVFLPDGRAPPVGSRHRQPRLAATLERIAADGARGFYEGPVAEALVGFLRERGGLHTLEDFAQTAGEYVTPIRTGFRGFEVWECPPNGQGVIALMILDLLARYAPAGAPLSVERVHFEIEAARLAYNERNLFVGDPAYGDVPVDWLLADEHIAELAAQIDPERAQVRLPALTASTTESTVYISVVDRDRNAISFINSLFAVYGSGLTEPRTGILLHNRGESFRLQAGHPNAIAPGKRPLHTLIPGMLTRDGRTCMSFGVMGGHYQALGQAQFLTRVFDYGCDLQEAMDLPRFFPCPDTGDVELESGVPRTVADGLRARGHPVTASTEPIGGAQVVWIDWNEDVLTGASDPRKDGGALGY